MDETPRQRLVRERIEGLIALAAPVLDVVLSAGERISRVGGADDEYYPIRPPGESFALDPGRAPLEAEESGGAPDA